MQCEWVMTAGAMICSSFPLGLALPLPMGVPTLVAHSRPTAGVTDVVDSTSAVVAVGDTEWRHTLDILPTTSSRRG